MPGGLERGGGVGFVPGALGFNCVTGVVGWERNEENVGWSFRNSSRGAKFKLRDVRSPEAGPRGTGLTGAKDDVDPPTELLSDPPETHMLPGVCGDSRLEEEIPLETPPLPKLLKDKSCGRGEGVGAALRGPSAVGVLAVGLAIAVPQNSCPRSASEVSSCRVFASCTDRGNLNCTGSSSQHCE